MQTPTKLTTKNSILIQVRTSEFDLEDDAIESCQSSSMVCATTKEVATTPRTKRRQQLIDKDKNVESIDIINKQIQVREKVAAKRAEATSEEVGRQRVLARERSIAR